jgi:hypothetical protein
MNDKASSNEHSPCSHLRAVTWAMGILVTLFILGSNMITSAQANAKAEAVTLKIEIEKLREDVVSGRVATAEFRQQLGAIRATLDRIEQRLYSGPEKKN